MHVKQDSYWQVRYMYGDAVNGEVRLSLKTSKSKQTIEVVVGVVEAKEFCDQLTQAIHQAELGEHNE